MYSNEGAYQDSIKRDRKTQTALRHVEGVPVGFTQQFRALADVCSSMSSGFVLLNEGEQVTYANQHALRLLRLHKRDLLTPEPCDVRAQLLTISAEPQQARPGLEQLWAATEREASTDLALADAAVQWLRVRAFPVHDERGCLLGRGVLLDDVTLERSAQQARNETLATAAHELKTPLAVIKGCATTLLGSTARWDPAMQREMLQMIDAQSDRLYEILNTLLDVWRFDAGTQALRLTQVGLSELMQQMVLRWLRNIPDHRFVLDIPPDVPAIICDAVRVEQVMHHLLDNAVKYSRAGSLIKMRLEANDDEVRVSIADEGIGLAAEDLDRIFDRFYRVREEQNGSGLGLAAARTTVEAHGGKIWADSLGEGRGATFYFTLPLTARTPTEVASQLMPTSSIEVEAVPTTPVLQQSSTRTISLRQDRRVKVLLAESDTRLTRYLRANLEEQQYRVQAVSHGVQFLRQLDLEEPDVIVLSTQLHDMRGVELLQRLREFSQTPVIMLCDDCDEDERVQILDAGCDDLVVKPFGMKELLARVRVLLRRQPQPTSELAVRPNLFSTGELTIDYAQHLVTVAEKQVQLSRTEYKLLSFLAQNVGMVVTHELLLEKVWGPEYNRDVDFIWVYISRLRRKIEMDSRHPRYILTVPDVGYKLAKW
ncbi:MAG TPA: ATP-binding protein [Ktedonobacteraceae bacterium]|nr:ATP-binding protein [Ktedonobacteraceae bacterium]